jgi:hypothetical protein
VPQKSASQVIDEDDQFFWCGVPLRRSADACQGERDVLKSV